MSKLDSLQEKIADKANEDAQKAIINFRNSVADDVRVLLGWDHGAIPNVRSGSPIRSDTPVYRAIAQILSANPKKGWPKEIWSKRRNKIEGEILGQMDMLQRTLVARPTKHDDCTPEPEQEDEK